MEFKFSWLFNCKMDPGSSDMEDLILKNAQIALEKHSDFRSRILEEAKQAVQVFRDDKKIYEQFIDHINRHLSSAKKVMKSFEDRGLAFFDLFRIAGFFAKEENFSNAVAAIIDPNKSHGLGNRPLESILEKIKHRNENKISSILKAITISEYIHVRRELHLGPTIPDIVVESDKFIIFIENKIRKGNETITKNGQQIFRQKCALDNRGKHLPDDCLLGIFLSPEGKLPTDNDFVRLSVSEFVEAIEGILPTKLTDTNITIKAFLQFYKLS
jgi:hypothetical protein